MKKELIFVAVFILVFPFTFSACSSNESTDGDTDIEHENSEMETDTSDGDMDEEPENTEEIESEIYEEEVEEAFEDEAEAELEEESVPDGLPETFQIAFTREDMGTPFSDEEITAFTKRLVGFMAKISYHDYLLRVTHGVDQSTGLPPWRLWWTSTQAVKSGDTVTFTCNPTSEGGADGGHNLMTRSAKILASSIAGYLLTGDSRMKKLTEEMCKGVTATMKGFVYDENDEIDWIMARNVIPLDQNFTTYEGYKKAFDCTNWRHDGGGWNCERFEYPNNPTWGDVWITNMRSKDDVSRVQRANMYIRYAAENAPDESVRSACGETAEYLQKFAKDIVDSEYHIRTKDKDSTPFIPDNDLASYVDYEVLIPNAECNAKSAAALIGYNDTLDNDCGKGEVNNFDTIVMYNKYFNWMIVCNYHLSNLAQSLSRWKLDNAKQLLQGVVERYEWALSLKGKDLPTDEDGFHRDLSASMMQAMALGFPPNRTEAELMMHYWNKTIEKGLQWPYWNLWDESVADGSYEHKFPDRITKEDDTYEYFVKPEDFGTFLDYCWSPFRNPEGIKFIDCDIVKDVANWNPEWAESEKK